MEKRTRRTKESKGLWIYPPCTHSSFYPRKHNMKCPKCNDTGLVEVTYPARQEAGHITDSETVTEKCECTLEE